MNTAEKTQRAIQVEYRPQSWDEVIGQKPVVESIQRQLKSPNVPHCFLITGPSGTGKTTIARILAREVGADPGVGIIELDAGTSGAVENMRALCEEMTYAPPMGRAKVLILDECHVLSKAAWNALLKSVEDTPDHAYYVFITTDEDKVIDTIKGQRATSYKLRPVPRQTLYEYGRDVIVPVAGLQHTPESIEVIADGAQGSPRKFLNLLGQCSGLSLDEIRDILVRYDADDRSPVIAILKLLMKGHTGLKSYADLLRQIDDFSGARITMKVYLSKVMLGDWSPTNARLLEIIDRMPSYPGSDGMADMMLAISRAVMTK